MFKDNSSIKINLHVILPEFSRIVEDALKQAGIPECFGNMIPPLLINNVSIQSGILRDRRSIPDDEIVLDDIRSLCESTTVTKDLVLTKDGLSELVAMKKEMARKHANRLIKCFNCNYTELCNNVTQNYLTAIDVVEKYENRGTL